MNFAWDLEILGRYYRDYERLMAHWREVLPLPILEVVYEDLVTDVDAVSRRLVAFCGLEWDARCLEFYKTKRPIRTASVTQVREPIYRSAVGKWRAYGNLLDPLLEELQRK